MYFILSINTRTNRGKIVGHALHLEDAIEEVVKCAREYVLEKSEPLLHRRDANEELLRTQCHYFSENSLNSIHHLDVFCQKTEYYHGWFQNEKTQPAELVRHFMYCAYNLPEDEIQQEIPECTTVAVRKKLPKILPTGGFPVDIISSLIDSEQFRKHRKTAEENSGPRHTFFDSSSEEED